MPGSPHPEGTPLLLFCPGCRREIVYTYLPGFAHPINIAEKPERRITTQQQRVIPESKRNGLHASMRLKTAAPLWLKSRYIFLTPTTYRRYQDYVDCLTKRLGNKRLIDIGAEDLRDYQIARVEKNVGACSINHELAIVKHILKRIGRWNAIREEYQRLPERPSSIGRALSKDEEKRLFELAASEPKLWFVAYWASILAINTTMGPGEITGLKLQDIYLKDRRVHVRRGHPTSKGGKTVRRSRPIPLNKHAVKALEQLLRRAKGLGSFKPEHYLLPYGGRSGMKPDPTRPARGWRTAWRSITRKAGLPGLRIYDLRHHAATVMDENGTSTRTIKAIMGHSPNSRVIEQYSHPRVNAKKKAVRALERRNWSAA